VAETQDQREERERFERERGGKLALQAVGGDTTVLGPKQIGPLVAYALRIGLSDDKIVAWCGRRGHDAPNARHTIDLVRQSPEKFQRVDLSLFGDHSGFVQSFNENPANYPDPEVAALIDRVRKQEQARKVVAQEIDQDRKIQIITADTITPEATAWLWQDWVAVGSFGLTAGREGTGKTTLLYQMAADITRGKLEGEFKGQPRQVIIAATEDSWAHTVVPRLMGAGADLSKIGRIDVVTSQGANLELKLPDDLPNLPEVIRQRDVALVILDPLISRLSGKLDTHKDAEVRQALEPIVKLADDTGVVVIGIIHVNKGTARDPLNMIMGSRAFSAVSRFVVFVATDPDDDSLRLVGLPKNNLGRTDWPCRTFTIEDHVVGKTEQGRAIHTGKLVWGADDERHIREIVRDSAREENSRAESLKEAKTWLREALEQAGGVMLSAEVKKGAEVLDISTRTLQRARTELKLKVSTKGKVTYWMLPDKTLDLCDVAEGAVVEPQGPETKCDDVGTRVPGPTRPPSLGQF
jgi:hypothetical protein